ncbi:MAG: hypothetical protein GY804_12545 [Alphaproteobacteria bacterium]|nr:hypothetical protein [Alphaproteobacteria bacterium]
MLERFGAFEAEVYFKCLQYKKGISVEEISNYLNKDADIINGTIDNLCALGMVVKKNEKYFAESSTKLANKIKDVLPGIATLLPLLSAFKSEEEGGFNIRSFSGKEGIKSIHEDILSTLTPLPEGKKFFYQMSSSRDLFEVVPEHQEHFINKRMEADILLYWMAPQKECYWPHAYKPDENFRFAKLFDIEMFPFHIELDVYHDKVAIICLHEGHLNGLVIHDELVAESFLSMSRFLWNNLHTL